MFVRKPNKAEVFIYLAERITFAILEFVTLSTFSQMQPSFGVEISVLKLRHKRTLMVQNACTE